MDKPTCSPSTMSEDFKTLRCLEVDLNDNLICSARIPTVHFLCADKYLTISIRRRLARAFIKRSNFFIPLLYTYIYNYPLFTHSREWFHRLLGEKNQDELDEIIHPKSLGQEEYDPDDYEYE